MGCGSSTAAQPNTGVIPQASPVKAPPAVSPTPNPPAAARASASAAAPPSSIPRGAPTPGPCDADFSHLALIYCFDCDERFCRDCDRVIHGRKKTYNHRRQAIPNPNGSLMASAAAQARPMTVNVNAAPAQPQRGSSAGNQADSPKNQKDNEKAKEKEKDKEKDKDGDKDKKEKEKEKEFRGPMSGRPSIAAHYANNPQISVTPSASPMNNPNANPSSQATTPSASTSATSPIPAPSPSPRPSASNPRLAPLPNRSSSVLPLPPLAHIGGSSSQSSSPATSPSAAAQQRRSLLSRGVSLQTKSDGSVTDDEKVLHQLSPDELRNLGMQQLNLIWNQYDIDGNGILDKRELKLLASDCIDRTLRMYEEELLKVNPRMSESALKKAVDKEMGFILPGKKPEDIHKEMVRMLTRKLDVNRDGTVTKTELMLQWNSFSKDLFSMRTDGALDCSIM